MTIKLDEIRERGRGWLKSELAPGLLRSVTQTGGDLYTKYLEWCNVNGVEPGADLADGLVRMLDDESLAGRVANVDVELRSIKMNEYRLDDMERVLDLKNKYDFGGGRSGVSEEFLENLVTKRLESTALGPLAGFETDGQDDVKKMIREEVNSALNDINKSTVENSVANGVPRLDDEMRPEVEGVEDDDARVVEVDTEDKIDDETRLRGLVSKSDPNDETAMDPLSLEDAVMEDKS